MSFVGVFLWWISGIVSTIILVESLSKFSGDESYVKNLTYGGFFYLVIFSFFGFYILLATLLFFILIGISWVINITFKSKLWNKKIFNQEP
jgi:uncharacterized membrane protein HdeD (DUF308 family)